MADIDFTYTVSAGQSSADLEFKTANALTLSGGVIRDAAFNNATLTLPFALGGGSVGAGSLSIHRNLVINGTITSILADTGQTNCYWDRQVSGRPTLLAQTVTDAASGLIFDNGAGLGATSNQAGAGGSLQCQWFYDMGTSLTSCESLTYAGFSDWRMPNIRELASIIDWTSATPLINATSFPNVSGIFWSSTTVTGNPNFAHTFDFGGQLYGTNDDNKTVARKLRCVRTGL